ncbi:MAG TPA: long-chain fatty acid--CoA ligase [Bacteroidales bacterium]|nr:long-chain fatty acid--CoA ligase [Bacteroidales bacterium]HRZ20949.1 long-chain fatty acid--CoA ligase [Bacteroidales bacterium]
MEITRVFDLLPYYKETFAPKEDALVGKEDGKWVKYSIDEYIEASNSVSYGLMALGIAKGDRIASISNNRPEWNFIDMGALQIGAIHVPIYPNISESDYKYILTHSEAKYVIVSGKDLLRKIEHILPEIPTLKGIYTLTPVQGYPHLKELIQAGKRSAAPEKLKAIKESILPDDPATLIYTSGTTGNPKGVVLCHRNMVSNFRGVKHIFPVDQTCRCLSFLPLCHVYERNNIYTYHILGVSIYYAENMATIADNLRELKPEIFCTVPRLLEKVYDRIIAKGLKLKGFKRAVFFWAVHLGLHYELDRRNGWWYELKLKLANKLVFSKWREGLGGKVRVIVSGGAALQPRLARIFTAAGIPILEGYGLTETSPVIAVNNLEPNGRKFGTVGPPLKEVQVRIAEDGEILCKGPNVMIGYFHDPALTGEVIDQDGWFHTGDIGILDEGRFLKITGRKKEVFKTSMGKYISPQPIENKFKESPFIESIMVIGENQKFAAALIGPDFEHLRSWCKVKGIEYTTHKEMIHLPRIKRRFQKEVDKYNHIFGATEQIKKFELLDAEWTIETGEITANLKVKRNYICEKYKDKINAIFNT